MYLTAVAITGGLCWPRCSVPISLAVADQQKPSSEPPARKRAQLCCWAAGIGWVVGPAAKCAHALSWRHCGLQGVAAAAASSAALAAAGGGKVGHCRCRWGAAPAAEPCRTLHLTLRASAMGAGVGRSPRRRARTVRHCACRWPRRADASSFHPAGLLTAATQMLDSSCSGLAAHQLLVPR
jgi:hypothetical protein